MIKRSIEADQEQHFRVDHLKADLKARSVRGGAVTTVSQIGKLVLNLGSLAILARLLTPQDFGLLAMVATLTNLVILFKDMGLSMATVQRAEINHEQVSTLFWINVAFSGIVSLLIAAIAPFVAQFYGEPKLVSITLALAAGLALSGFIVQHEALMRRQMRFKDLAIIQLGSLLVGAATATILALSGWGYWALVLKQIAEQITNLVGVWVLCTWRPGLPVWSSEVRSMVTFGGNFTGFNFVNYFARNLDNILIGWRWGALPLGLYDKAYQLFLLPIQQVNLPFAAVATPALSRMVDSPESYRRAYLRVVEKIALITMPFVAFTIATSDWIIRVALGEQWMGASDIFVWLGFTALVQPIANSTGWLFLTQGRTREMFQWGIMGSTLSVVAIILGLPWGPVGVAIGYSLNGLLLQTPLLFWFVCRKGPIKTKDFYVTIAPSALAAMVALLAMLGFRQWFKVGDPLLGLAIAIAITLLTSGLALSIVPAGRRAIQDLIAISHIILNRTRLAK